MIHGRAHRSSLLTLFFIVSACSRGEGNGTETEHASTGHASIATTDGSPSTAEPPDSDSGTTSSDTEDSPGRVTATEPTPMYDDDDDEFVPDPLDRVMDDVVVMYRFNEAGGTIVRDVSNAGAPLDLASTAAQSMVWGTDSLTVTGATRLNNVGAPTKIVDDCMLSNEITIELWVRAQAATGSGHVVNLAITPQPQPRAFTMAQSGSGWTFRLNTELEQPDGSPALFAEAASVTEMSHVVYRFSELGESVYIDGEEVATGARTGTFEHWPVSGMTFLLANDVANVNAPFLGEFGLAAVYCRALDDAEIAQNLAAGY